MERKRLKGVLIKTEPCDLGINSGDSSEEMEMNDNGHVTDDEYSEMTYDDMKDFKFEVDKGNLAGFNMKGTIGKTAIDELNSSDAEDGISPDADFKTDEYNIDQIDDIQFKAMDALLEMYPCDNGRQLSDNEFDEILKKTDDMFSDIQAFAAYTNIKETENETDTSISSEVLPAVSNENNNDSGSVHCTESECNNNIEDSTSGDQNLADSDYVCSVKAEKVVDTCKFINDKDPVKSDGSAREFSDNIAEKNVSGNEINLITVKQERNAENSLQKGDCKQTESATASERDQGAEFIKKETLHQVGRPESCDFGNKNETTHPKMDSANFAKRPRMDHSWLNQGLHTYLPVSMNQQTSDAISNIQSLCDKAGVPSPQGQAPTAANYLNRNNFMNTRHHNYRPPLSAIHKLNAIRNGIRQNLPAYPSVSNQRSVLNQSTSNGRFPVSGLTIQGARPEAPGVNTGTMNQSRPGYLVEHAVGNQGFDGHYQTLCSNSNSLWNNAQMQQNNSRSPFSGNNPQRPMNKSNSYPGLSGNNNGACNKVNPRLSQQDFEQSLDDFNVDLLGFSDSATQGSFNTDGSAINNQHRDIYSNRPRNVNNVPSNMCHRPVNRQSFPPNPVQRHSTYPGYPVQSSQTSPPPQYPQGSGQFNQLNHQFSHRIGSSAACPQPSSITQNASFNNMHSSPKSVQQFTTPLHQTRQHNFSGSMNTNTSINNRNNLLGNPSSQFPFN